MAQSSSGCSGAMSSMEQQQDSQQVLGQQQSVCAICRNIIVSEVSILASCSIAIIKGAVVPIKV